MIMLFLLSYTYIYTYVYIHILRDPKVCIYSTCFILHIYKAFKKKQNSDYIWWHTNNSDYIVIIIVVTIPNSDYIWLYDEHWQARTVPVRHCPCQHAGRAPFHCLPGDLVLLHPQLLRNDPCDLGFSGHIFGMILYIHITNIRIYIYIYSNIYIYICICICICIFFFSILVIQLYLYWLVVEPTPLKNDGVRHLGWWHSQYMGK